MTAQRETAVVIGASMAGLVAARALTEHFERVIVLERDPLPAAGEQRRGVPQGQHAHALLAGGREALERLFPGLTAELVAVGALTGDLTLGSRMYNEGGYHCQFASGLVGLLLSRPLLEAQVRQRVCADERVTMWTGCDALGLLTDAAGNVNGVRLLRRAPHSAEETLAADLVVDASGRGSQAPEWLAALGYERPVEERVAIKVGYATRRYRLRPEHAGGARALVAAASPATMRAGVALAQEGDQWIVTLAGYFGDYPPTDEADFAAFARSLAMPDIHDLITTAEPLSAIVTARYPASQRRRYERLRRFPRGFLVFGDAICSFNPIYGQGMTVAAMEALALADCLDGPEDRLAVAFFERAARLIDSPWRIAVGADLRFAQTEGKRTPLVRFINWYVAQLHRAAHHDPAVSLAFHRVANLLAPPPSLLGPAVALRVLRGRLRRPGAHGRAAVTSPLTAVR